MLSRSTRRLCTRLPTRTLACSTITKLPTLSAVVTSSVPTQASFHTSACLRSDNHGNIVRNEKYAKLTNDDISYFRSILSDGGVVTDPFDIEPYNRDWMKKWSGNCQLVLKPSTTEEVSLILKYCNERTLAVVPQGGNTGLVGGSIPIFDEIIINLEKMNRVIEFNEIQGIITVEAGMILENLMKYLDPLGYIVPLDLGAKGSCQIGGNISTNAGGLRLVRYGSLHGSVLGLEMVLANGEVIDCLTSLRKDNTGYDLKQLFIGAEGTLGIVTKVSILTPPKPKSVKVIYLSLPDYASVLKAMKYAKQYLVEILSACEYEDGHSLKMVLDTIPGTKYPFGESGGTLDTSRFYMLIETHGNNTVHDSEKLDLFLEHLYENMEDIDGVIAESDTQALQLWKLREGVAEAANHSGYVYKYDVSLPVSKMEEFTLMVREKCAPLGAVTIGYGHLGDGNLHINIVTKEKQQNIYDTLEPWIFSELQKIRGSISAEHGLGQAKNEFIEYSKPKSAVQLMKQIKHLFDPKGILNPYKYLPVDK